MSLPAILSPPPDLLSSSPLRFTATTTGVSEVVTLARLTVSKPSRIAWGDGISQILPANSTAAITHTYAVSGTYNVTLENAKKVTQLRLDNAKIGKLNTAELRYSPITYFYVILITGSMISSADMTAWMPTYWYLYSMPAGTYSISSADMTSWRPTEWYLSSMPAGTYLISSADMVAWRPTYWYLHSMPAGTYSISSADTTAWRPTYWYLYSMPAGTYSISSADMTSWRPTDWYLSSMPAGTYLISSADMVAWRPTTWYLSSMPAGTYLISSADMVAWRPTYWYLHSMPAGTYSISSADTTAWRPTYWYLHSMPAGTYLISSADMVAWRPTIWRLYSMPAAGSSYTFAASCMRNWTALASLTITSLGLDAATIDLILTDLYAGRMGYTALAPVALMAGTNADPTGIYQAMVPPTTGLETKYELVNDSAAQGFKKWAITT